MRRKKVWSMIVVLAMAATLAAGCGSKENEPTPTPTDAAKPTAATKPTDAPKPTAVPVSAVKDISSVPADCVVDFENGAAGFVQLDQYPLLADTEAVVEIADVNGQKMLKMEPSNANKEMIVGIDAGSLLGDKVEKLHSVTMDMYLGREDGKFYACSGLIYSYTGEGGGTKNSEPWSVYLEKANPKTAERVFSEKEVFAAGQNNIIAVSKITDNSIGKSDAATTLYVDNIVFWDADGNPLQVDTGVSFNGPEGFGAAEAGAGGFTDRAIDIYALMDSSNDDTKTYNISWADVAATGVTKVKKILFEIVGDFSSAGWIGGGGSIGFNYGEDSWYDANVNDVCNFEITDDQNLIEIEIPAEIADQIDLTGDGTLMIGFWWGSVPTATLTRLEIKDGSGPSAWTDHVFEPLTVLNGGDMYQLAWTDIAAAGIGVPKQIIAELVGEFSAAEKIEGSASIGFNSGADWYQVDYDFTENIVSGDAALLILDIPSDVAEKIDMTGGIVQVGFWWGLPNVTLTKLDFR